MKGGINLKVEELWNFNKYVLKFAMNYTLQIAYLL